MLSTRGSFETPKEGHHQTHRDVQVLCDDPRPGQGHPAARLPFENAAADDRDFKLTSKVGVSDEAILIDQPYMKGLGSLLLEATQFQSPETMLFDFEPSDATKLFNQVVVELGYDQHGINCSYQIRHGSASTAL